MANVTFKLEADEADAVRGFLKLVDAQKQTEQQFSRTNKTGKDFSDVLNSIGFTSAVAGFMSISTAVETARKALASYNAERQAGADRLKGSEFEMSKLVQQAALNPSQATRDAELKRMVREANKSSTDGGMDLNAAARLQFELESSGQQKNRDMYAGLHGIIDDPAAIAKAVTIERSAFGKNARSPRQTLNQALLAAGPETINLDEVALNISSIAAGISQIGGSPEEGVASLAMLSGTRSDPQKAATEIRALDMKIMALGLGGQGMFSAMDAMKKRTAHMSDKKLRDYFGGDQESMGAFLTLSPRIDELRQRAKDIGEQSQEGPDDPVAAMMKTRAANADINTPRAARISVQVLEGLKADRHGVEMTEEEIAVNAVDAASLKLGESPFRRGIRNSMASTAKMFGASPNAIMEAGAWGNDQDERARTRGFDSDLGSQKRHDELIRIMKELIATVKGGQSKFRSNHVE